MTTENNFYCDAEDNGMARCADQCYYCLKKEQNNLTNG